MDSARSEGRHILPQASHRSRQALYFPRGYAASAVRDGEPASKSATPLERHGLADIVIHAIARQATRMRLSACAVKSDDRNGPPIHPGTRCCRMALVAVTPVHFRRPHTIHEDQVERARVAQSPATRASSCPYHVSPTVRTVQYVSNTRDSSGCLPRGESSARWNIGRSGRACRHVLCGPGTVENLVTSCLPMTLLRSLAQWERNQNVEPPCLEEVSTPVCLPIMRPLSRWTMASV